MSLLGIILFIVLGVALLLIEFLIAPGITIAGIGGILLIGVGVYLGYKVHGTPAGHYVLIGTVFFTLLTMFISLRSTTWKKIMLTSSIEGKSSDSLADIIKPGDTGKTISRLTPIGNVLINEMNIEAKSTGEFIDVNTEIEVIKVVNDKLIVKPKN